PRTTFEEALEIYYRIHVATLRKQSQRGLRQTINRRFRTTLGKKVLSDIRPVDIAPLLDAMIDTPTERHNAFVYLAMLFNWCMRRIGVHPSRPSPDVGNNLSRGDRYGATHYRSCPPPCDGQRRTLQRPHAVAGRPCVQPSPVHRADAESSYRV